eukprot:10116845-Prorocentrum_lima.AAC.1
MSPLRHPPASAGTRTCGLAHLRAQQQCLRTSVRGRRIWHRIALCSLRCGRILRGKRTTGSPTGQP